jgi:hypothetical protein
MASPAPRPPAGGPNDEALEILRRIEPALTRLGDDLRRVQIDVAELKGHMVGIEGQLRQVPTLWTIAGTMLAINSGIVAVAALAVTLFRSALVGH